MRFRISVTAAMLMSAFALVSAQSLRPDPFGFLRPTIEFTANEKRQLDQRDVILQVLPASGHELATMAASSVSVGPDMFIARVSNIVLLKKGAKVPEIGKFSNPPAIGDLQTLTLDEVDLRAIARCRPNRCALKLTGAEIERLKTAGGSDANAAAIEREFRQIVLERATNYLARGEDESKANLIALVQHSPFLSNAPRLVKYIEHYPAAPIPGSESFLYWSKETYAWNPMISVTHVTIVRNTTDPALPEVLVLTRDIFATRYTEGSLVLASLIRDPGSPSSRRYLVYLNRTWVDGVRALWRPFVEYRVKTQAKKVFASVRDRLENGSALSTQ